MATRKKKSRWTPLLMTAGPAAFGVLATMGMHWWSNRQESAEQLLRHAQDSTARAVKDSTHDLWVDKRLKRLEVNDGFRDDTE